MLSSVFLPKIIPVIPFVSFQIDTERETICRNGFELVDGIDFAFGATEQSDIFHRVRFNERIGRRDNILHIRTKT